MVGGGGRETHNRAKHSYHTDAGEADERNRSPVSNKLNLRAGRYHF